ncbi:GSU2403 family nucleotidyltransferase fold protein, partial [Acinetobacter baumannii]
TLDVDFAHAGRNISVALPASIKLDVHGALESLEMGLLPITQFNGLAGAQDRNPKDQELRVDFVTSMTRSNKVVVLPELNLALEPLKF